MIDAMCIKTTDLVIAVEGQARPGTRFWVVADGERGREFADRVVEALRRTWPSYASGAASVVAYGEIPRRDYGLPGPGFDLRGVGSDAELDRRIAQGFAEGPGANHYALAGDEGLRNEIHRTTAHASREWPHHREHSMRAVYAMHAELMTREGERKAAADAARSPDDERAGPAP